MDKHDIVTVGDTFSDIINDTTDDFKSITVSDITDLYKYAIPGRSLLTGLAKQYIEDESFKTMIDNRLSNTTHLKEIKRIALKMSEGKNFWDKTPVKLDINKRFPSLTSVNEYLHPIQDRMLNLKEVARIMGYPDWYDFTDKNNECTIPTTQAIAQGVPVNFGKYIANQVANALNNKLDTLDDTSIDFTYQDHIKEVLSTFKIYELDNMTSMFNKNESFKLV